MQLAFTGANNKPDLITYLEALRTAGHFDRSTAPENALTAPFKAIVYRYEPGVKREDWHLNHLYGLFHEHFGIHFKLIEIMHAMYQALPAHEARLFPERFFQAVPVGADVNQVETLWLNWVLTGPDSPVAPYHQLPQVLDIARMYQRKLQGEPVPLSEWEKVRDSAWRIGSALHPPGASAKKKAARTAAGAAANFSLTTVRMGAWEVDDTVRAAADAAYLHATENSQDPQQARDAAWTNMAARLIQLLETSPVPEEIKG